MAAPSRRRAGRQQTGKRLNHPPLSHIPMHHTHEKASFRIFSICNFAPVKQNKYHKHHGKSPFCGNNCCGIHDFLLAGRPHNAQGTACGDRQPRTDNDRSTGATSVRQSTLQSRVQQQGYTRIHQERGAKQFDNNYDVLYGLIRDKQIASGETFGEAMSKYGGASKAELNAIATKFPLPSKTEIKNR